MRWVVAAVVFVVASAPLPGTPLSGHLAAEAALVLLGALAVYASVLIVMRIKARVVRNTRGSP
jgi:hypothetical protein